jgi:hypothetical protein
MIELLRRPISSSLLVAFVAGCALGAATVSADAPAGQYEVAADTVKDQKTGLTWQRNPDTKTRTWAEAKAYCESLDVAGGGWRLPRLKELLTIVDSTRGNPAIDPTAFPNTMLERYWSATRYAGNTVSAWTLVFSVGYSNYANEADTYFTRCVR